MQGSLWSVYLAAVGLALLQAGLFTFQAFENRRFTRARCRRRETGQPAGHVLLLAPCKGNETGLRENLDYLLLQDYPGYEVRFIVESSEDPALGVIREIIESRPHVKTSVCIAGRAMDCGQKVHNLRAATAELPPETKYLAFVDSDARPRPNWLRALIARLAGREAGAATGYRWFVPARPTLANFLLSSINANVAGLLGPGDHHFVWGGSWAIAREVFERIGLRDAWRGTLSDDLVATQVLRRHNLGIEYEPRCLVSSPLDIGFEQLFEFLRRQYLIGRVYATRWWLGAVLVSTLASGIFWINLAVAIFASALRWDWAWIPVSAAGLLWASHGYRAWLRQDMAWHSLPDLRDALRGCRLFDLCGSPVSGLVNVVGLLSSLFGNTIAWRGIRYRLYRGGQARRVPDAPSADAPRAAVPAPHVGREQARKRSA